MEVSSCCFDQLNSLLGLLAQYWYTLQLPKQSKASNLGNQEQVRQKQLASGWTGLIRVGACGPSSSCTY